MNAVKVTAQSFYNKETTYPLQTIPIFSMFRQIVFFPLLFSFLFFILIYFNLTVAEEVTETSIDRVENFLQCKKNRKTCFLIPEQFEDAFCL